MCGTRAPTIQQLTERASERATEPLPKCLSALFLASETVLSSDELIKTTIRNALMRDPTKNQHEHLNNNKCVIIKLIEKQLKRSDH